MELFVFTDLGRLVFTDSIRLGEAEPSLFTAEALAGDSWVYLAAPFHRAAETGASSATMLTTNEGRWLVSMIAYYGLAQVVQRVFVYYQPILTDCERGVS